MKLSYYFFLIGIVSYIPCITTFQQPHEHPQQGSLYIKMQDNTVVETKVFSCSQQATALERKQKIEELSGIPVNNQSMMIHDVAGTLIVFVWDSKKNGEKAPVILMVDDKEKQETNTKTSQS